MNWTAEPSRSLGSPWREPAQCGEFFSSKVPSVPTQLSSRRRRLQGIQWETPANLGTIVTASEVPCLRT
jgi:hypothetical protein